MKSYKFAILWNDGETTLTDVVTLEHSQRLGKFVNSYTSFLGKFTQVYVNGCVVFENKE